MEIIIIAILTCVSILVLLIKFMGWNKTLKFHKGIDIMATIGLGMFFMGTFSGLATGIMAGVLLSVTLGIANALRRTGKRIRFE